MSRQEQEWRSKEPGGVLSEEPNVLYFSGTNSGELKSTSVGQIMAELEKAGAKFLVGYLYPDTGNSADLVTLVIKSEPEHITVFQRCCDVATRNDGKNSNLTTPLIIDTMMQDIFVYQQERSAWDAKLTKPIEEMPLTISGFGAYTTE